ncbi:MAG: hypothetical protein ACKVON_15470 [Beijerinckiaceae bacterium]
MIRMFSMTALALLMSISAAPAQSEPPTVPIGANYDDIRPETVRKLALGGYKPSPTPRVRSETCKTFPHGCARYPELESCVGSGIMPCRMAFSPGLGGFNIITTGDGARRTVLRIVREQ